MSQLPAGTFAYRWFNGTLGRNQLTVRSTGGSATYDTVFFPIGFTRDHTKLVTSFGPDMRLYDIDTGDHEEISFGASTTVHVIHPTRTEVIIGRVGQTFLEVYDYVADSYTPTSIPRSSTNTAEYNPAGTILYVLRTGSPYLSLYDADTLAPLANPISLSSYLSGEPRLALAFNPAAPTAALSCTGSNFLGYYNVDTGAQQWNVTNLDANWAYWSSVNPIGDLVSVASDAFTLAQHTQIRQTSNGAVVNYIASPSGTGFTHGVFTGDGDDILVCNHDTFADRVIDARTEVVQYTLLGDASAAVTLPPYVAPPIVDPFWANRVRTQEVI